MEEGKYIFWYGYNSPNQVALLMGVPLEDVLKDSIACTLKGYKRAFAGSTDFFGATERSVCTIIEDEQAEIKSYAFKVSDDKIKFIDEFEDYPVMYDRITVQWKAVGGEVFDAYVYTMNDISHFGHPTMGYLKGVAQTVAAHYYLSKQQFDFEKIEIEVIKAKNEERGGADTVEFKLEEYPELIQAKIEGIINE